MKRAFLSFVSFLLVSFSFAQIETEFVGIYLRDDFKATMEISEDESGSADFLFTLEFADVNDVMLNVEGKGNFSDHDIFFMEINNKKYKGQLEIDEFGLTNLYLDYPSNKSRMNFTLASQNESYNEAVFLESQIFLKENGAELDVFDNHGLIGFRIISSDSDACGVREFSGFMNPTDSDWSVLFFEDQSGCQIEFLSSDKGIFINQTNCNVKENCEDFSGLYLRTLED